MLEINYHKLISNIVVGRCIKTTIIRCCFLCSKANNAKKRKLQDLQNEVEECVKKLKKTNDSIAAESVSIEKTERWFPNVTSIGL